MYNQKPLLGTLINWGHPLSKGLVGAWLFNEGSGNKTNDIIGGNYGTFGAGAAAPAWMPGKNDLALDFDGTDDYVETSDYNFLNGLSGFSICIGIKSDVISVDTDIWHGKLGDALTIRYDSAGYKGSGTNVIQFQVNTTGGEEGLLESSSFVQSTDQQFLVGTWNGSDLALYIAGILDAPTYNVGASGTITGADRCQFGHSSTYSTYWDGFIDKIMIYSRALSASEVWQLYTNPYCMFAQPMEAELMYAAPPVGAIMNQFQKAKLGADLYDGVLIA